MQGCIQQGWHWDEDDAVVVATHGPNEPREFITTFGLNQPGVQVTFKLYVMLTTGNEAGSAACSKASSCKSMITAFSVFASPDTRRE